MRVLSFLNFNGSLSQDRVDPARNHFQKVFEELPSRPPVGLSGQLGDCELAGPVDGNGEIELSFGCLHFGDIHVKEANGVALEALTLGLVLLDIRQP